MFFLRKRTIAANLFSCFQSVFATISFIWWETGSWIVIERASSNLSSSHCGEKMFTLLWCLTSIVKRSGVPWCWGASERPFEPQPTGEPWPAPGADQDPRPHPHLQHEDLHPDPHPGGQGQWGGKNFNPPRPHRLLNGGEDMDWPSVNWERRFLLRFSLQRPHSVEHTLWNTHSLLAQMLTMIHFYHVQED